MDSIFYQITNKTNDNKIMDESFYAKFTRAGYVLYGIYYSGLFWLSIYPVPFYNNHREWTALG